MLAHLSWSNGWMVWYGSASAWRSRYANTTSQSARWQSISRAFHFPGAGGRSAPFSPSVFKIAPRRPGVEEMTAMGSWSPKNEAYGFMNQTYHFWGGTSSLGRNLKSSGRLGECRDALLPLALPASH